MSRDANYVTKDVAPVPAGKAADYKAAFAQRSASAFAVVFAEDLVLEAAGVYWPVSGRENVKRVMEAAALQSLRAMKLAPSHTWRSITGHWAES